MNTITRIVIAFLGVFTIATATAQNNNVGIGTTAPNASAKLEITSTSQGFLPPRMRLGEILSITSPAEGLVVYNTTQKKLNVFNGSRWEDMNGDFINISVQERLDLGETPKQIYDSGMPLDSIYGKTYKGGLIAYLNTTNGTGLIAATSDQDGGSGTGLLIWSPESVITNAVGTAIGTGLANTNLIPLAQQFPGGSYAARICLLYSVTVGSVTYDDWYLPSKDELYELYKNLNRYGCTAAAPGAVDFSSCTTKLGGFVNSGVYWSSSEGNANTNNSGQAWTQSLAVGNQSLTSKNASGRVRPIRSF